MRRATVRCIALMLLATLMLPAGCAGEPEAAITVSNADGPMAGIDIVAHDATGAPTAHVTTGADGRARAAVEQGGMITVLMADGSWRERATIMGVRPGDELTFVSPRLRIEERGTANVSLSEYPGAATYVIELGCATVYTGQISQPISIDVRSNCLSADGTLQVLATALGGEGLPLAHSWLRGVAWTQPLELTMPPWSDVAAYTVEASNAPAGAVGLRLEVSCDAGGVALCSRDAAAGIGPGGSASLSVRYAPGFADALESSLALVFSEEMGSIHAASLLLARRSTLPASEPVDLGATLLPAIEWGTIEAVDPARPAMSWTRAGDLSGTDGGVLRFAWSTTESWERWMLLVPPDVPSPVTLPALPEELSAWAPPAGATYVGSGARFVDAGWIASYDAFRTDISAAFLGDFDVRFPDADATARVSMARQP